jgi:amidase
MDATVVSRILEAGGIITGKAVCENLSTSAASFTAATGPVDNPYAKGYSAGGSSSGTANLVAKGEVDLGIGADQGGSIRIPASLCGLVGFKATAGLVPYTGCVSNEATIDYVGPITRTCLENAVLLEAIAGVDGLDDRQQAGTPFRDQVPKYSQILLQTKDAGVKGLRIGILKEGISSKIMDPGIGMKFQAAAKVFEELGAIIEEVSIPMHTIAPAIFGAASKQGGAIGRVGRASGRRQVMLTDLYEKMLPCTAQTIEKVRLSSIFRGHKLTDEQMSPISKNAVFAGEYCWQRFPHVYAKAINLSRKLTETYDSAFEKYDVLIMPTTITQADPLPFETDSAITKMSKTIGKLDNTCSFNATGHPALAFPIGFVPAKGNEKVSVPASMQVVGKYWDEITCLKVAFAWENAKNWKEF